MQVTIRLEAGYDMALYGMSLSFKDRAIPPEDWWDMNPLSERFIPGASVRKYKISERAKQNANLGLGHNKFRRQIMLWVDIEAPRFWWSEFDTYKVGTVAQSESTMHTLKKRDITEADFENGCVPISFDIKKFNSIREALSIEVLKAELPESYLQRRLVALNYEVLSCMITQRKNHRLRQWHYFIEEIYRQAQHPELLPSK